MAPAARRSSGVTTTIGEVTEGVQSGVRVWAGATPDRIVNKLADKARATSGARKSIRHPRTSFVRAVGRVGRRTERQSVYIAYQHQNLGNVADLLRRRTFAKITSGFQPCLTARILISWTSFPATEVAGYFRASLGTLYEALLDRTTLRFP